MKELVKILIFSAFSTGIVAPPLVAQNSELAARVDRMIETVIVQQVQLSALENSKDFIIVNSDGGSGKVESECTSYWRTFWKSKVIVTCPSEYPYLLSGNCSMKTGKNPGLASSEPLKTGDGWRCETVHREIEDCQKTATRVWATCTKRLLLLDPASFE